MEPGNEAGGMEPGNEKLGYLLCTATYLRIEVEA